LRNHTEAFSEQGITSFMGLSFDEAFGQAEDRSAMSAQRPAKPLGDRPRMAEALASLKEGLRDTADPLYDSWKLRQVVTDRPVVVDVELPGPIAAANPEQLPDEDASRPEAVAEASRRHVGALIDNALEGTPPEILGAGSTSDSLDDAPPADGPSTEELLIEFDDEFGNSDAEPTAVRRPSVQADTVRVRVIRYRPFPRWALVVAASLVVFAVSLVALRASFPGQSARVARPVLASDVPAASPAQRKTSAAFPASNAAVAPVPPGLSAAKTAAAPAAAAPPATGSTVAPPVEPVATSPAPTPIVAQPARAAAPAVKTPPAPAKRRSGAQEFFRDPGF
jgi:hypothetical protein